MLAQVQAQAQTREQGNKTTGNVVLVKFSPNRNVECATCKKTVSGTCPINCKIIYDTLIKKIIK